MRKSAPIVASGISHYLRAIEMLTRRVLPVKTVAIRA